MSLYEGILPDLFREGQGVVVQGELEKAIISSRRSAGETRRKLHATRS